jgi:hypothetical protein
MSLVSLKQSLYSLSFALVLLIVCFMEGIQGRFAGCGESLCSLVVVHTFEMYKIIVHKLQTEMQIGGFENVLGSSNKRVELHIE